MDVMSRLVVKEKSGKKVKKTSLVIKTRKRRCVLEKRQTVNSATTGKNSMKEENERVCN